MSNQLSRILCLFVGLSSSACQQGLWPEVVAPDASEATDGAENASDAGVSSTDATAPSPSPSPVPITTLVTWVRASLSAPYALTPRAEYGRIEEDGKVMSDDDFTTTGVVVSAAQKMDELAIGVSGSSTTDPIPDAADRQRSQSIPFRGNPSDVKLVEIEGKKKIFVPLGGDVMTPGNEVAIVSAGRLETRVRVGVRPLRVAVHPAGLVFVCNQYSNFVSIIDPRTNSLLTSDGKPVEVATEYYCTDLLFVPENPRSPQPDRQFLFVANRWRGSVLKYEVRVLRDPTSNRPIGIEREDAPLAEITGVGSSPWRLALNEQQDALYVANNKGGEVSRIDLASNLVTKRVAIGAPSADVVNISDLLFVPTTTRDRGLLAAGDQHPVDVLANPVDVVGLDGARHRAHPGAMFDGTKSYNFEDVRNGLMQLDFMLGNDASSVYYTDDVSSEANYSREQKVIAGALPTTIVRSRAGTEIYVALAGSKLVEELAVDTGRRPFTLTAQKTFQTGARPFGLALDETERRLYVANWGSETLSVFDLDRGGAPLTEIDLGYAQPAYPATNIERGEFFYYDATWSNNGRKSCASCHFDELDTDGVGFSNGAEAPTAFHQVKPNHNLMTTGSYFWNGSFANGDYSSLAFAAQTRTNCELVSFALIEGPASDPARRVGDPNNRYTNGRDAECRPVSAGLGTLSNQASIDLVVAQEKVIARRIIRETTGFDAQTVSRLVDLYSVAELRLPPNPLRQAYVANKLDGQTRSEIQQGATLFASAGCSGCHDPTSQSHPFADGRNHGSGANWTARFVDTYANDPRITATITAFSQTMLDAIRTDSPDHEMNVYVDAVDSFTPFCFDIANCLVFEDPLAARGSTAEETRRLNLLVSFNLSAADRQFIPGNVRGAPQINTPSLRGVWTQTNLLRHGLAHSIREAILAPGHRALADGETGFAVDALGHFDVHGATQSLTPSEVGALVRYVESIE